MSRAMNILLDQDDVTERCKQHGIVISAIEPLPGAGTWADGAIAISATGDGEAIIEGGYVMPLGVLDWARNFLRADHEVAKVRLRAVRAGDVPASPPIFERRAIVDGKAASGEQGLAARVNEQRANQMPRNAFGARRAVAG